MDNRVAALVRKFELCSTTAFCNNCKTIDHDRTVKCEPDSNIDGENEGQFAVVANSSSTFEDGNFHPRLTEIGNLGKPKSLPNVSEDTRNTKNRFSKSSNCCAICKIQWGKCIDDVPPVNIEDISEDEDNIHCKSSAHCSELCRRKCQLFKNDKAAHLRPVIISQQANLLKARSLAKYWLKQQPDSISQNEKLKSNDAHSESLHIVHSTPASNLIQRTFDYDLAICVENKEFSDIFECSFSSQEDEINDHVDLYNKSIDVLMKDQ